MGGDRYPSLDLDMCNISLSATMRIAYFDCFSGIAGDMALGALIDAGASLDELKQYLRSIPQLEDEWDLRTEKVVKGKGHIAAIKAHVDSIYNHEPIPAPVAHDHTHHHSHDHDSSPDHGPSRNLAIITSLINKSKLPEAVKNQSISVFRVLAQAEASTHGTTIDKVHFHEVGAVDSIIDTVGTVLALHLLKIDAVYCSALPYGQGWVKAAHGLMPVPAPATLQILQGIPTCPAPCRGELVTPTGASLMKALAVAFGPPPPFTPQVIGIGAGSKEFDEHPNILRVIIGERDSDGEKDEELMLLESNIDDMNPQIAAYVCELLLEKGALDVWMTAIQMKKGRPGFQLSFLSQLDTVESLSRILFIETTTLGIRKQLIQRSALQREIIPVETIYGCIRVKIGRLNSEIINVHAEYEDCKAIAKAKSIPLTQVMKEAEQQVRVNF